MAIAEHPVNINVAPLPPLGTMLPELGGIFAAIMRAKPGSGLPDYALIVPSGAQFEYACAWGGYGESQRDAACMWDGQANTRALVASTTQHPAAEFCASCSVAGFSDFYLPSLRELKALFASGCEAFSEDGWYWSSTQFSRVNAYLQNFGHGNTYDYYKSWAGGRARAVRSVSIQSLIN